MTLRADVNRPGSQEDMVSNWAPAHSLVEDAISAAEMAPRLLATAVTCLSLCLWRARGRPAASQFSFGIRSVLCSLSGQGQAVPLVTAFCWKVRSLSLCFSLAIPQLGLLSHDSSHRLSSGHSGLVLTLSMEPTPPYPAPARSWQT